MYDVIISIVTYNNEDIIIETVESILKNISELSYRIIICDNNSTDKTIALIKALNSSKISIIEQDVNKGFGYGHNKVIFQYQAKYYLVYNPDLRIRDNIVKKIFEYMQSHEEIGMMTPRITYPSGEIQYLCKENPTVFDLFLRRFIPKRLKKYFRKINDRYEMRQTGYDNIFKIPYATGCFMFFRGDILKKINGFDERFFMYLEDADITRRANKLAICAFYPYGSVEHLWEKGSHKSLKLTWITIKSAVYYFNKWGWEFWPNH